MSAPTEQPAPVVLPRHMEVWDEIKSQREQDASRFASLREADLNSIKILARAFPIQVPTTDRPTAPGWYWYKMSGPAKWAMLQVLIEADTLWSLWVDNTSGEVVKILVDQLSGKWQRIPTPDELAGKGQA